MYSCNSSGTDDNGTTTPPYVGASENNRTGGESFGREIMENFVIPCVLALGLVGNLTSMVVFSQKRLRHGFDSIEQSATVGLMALALSDFCFCLVGVPNILLHISDSRGNDVLIFIIFFYRRYHKGLLNLFLCSSTWVTVLVSVERYIAVCHPFQAQSLIGAKRTLFACVLIFVLAIALNVPHFMKYALLETDCAYYYTISRLFLNESFLLAYTIIWSILGTLVPFLSLVYCNTRLIAAIQRSRARGIVDAERYSTSRITLILVVIVCLYLILVCPSSALALVERLVGKLQIEKGYRPALVITNFTQAVNFSVNFLLYVIMCKQFRRAMTSHTCRKAIKCKNKDHGTPRPQIQGIQLRKPHRYQMVYRPHAHLGAQSPHRVYTEQK